MSWQRELLIIIVDLRSYQLQFTGELEKWTSLAEVVG